MEKENDKRQLTKKRVQKHRKKRKILEEETTTIKSPIPVNETSYCSNDFLETKCDEIKEKEKYTSDQSAESVEYIESTEIEENINIETIHQNTIQNANNSFSDSYYSNNDSDVESLSENHNNDEDSIIEIQEIKQWALRNNIRQNHLTELLLILRKNLIPELPKTAATFLQTSSRKYDIEKWDSGEFIYIGLSNGLLHLPNLSISGNIIEMMFNVDGTPLHRSSEKQFWPILGQVYSDHDLYKPFPIALYYGVSKPPLNLYMMKFIEELIDLHKKGIELNGKWYKIKIKCFICDSPARAFLKNIKGHGGFGACERCTVHGLSFQRRVIYPEINCTERSDENFRLYKCKNHHKGETPLVNIKPKLNLTSDFILDFMHLACLGVMRKLLLYWCEDIRYKLSYNSKVLLSKRMEKIRRQVPIEFHRKPRSIFQIRLWKATEFRFFLLYCGPLLLKDLLNKETYKHFLFLHIACRILCDKEYAIPKNEQAKYYLKNFVQLAATVYNTEFLVLNVHNLIHLADDVKNMNCSLNNITSFPFENYLGEIKRLLRSGNRPLAQVCRRLQEKQFENNKLHSNNKIIILKSKVSNDQEGTIVTKMKFKNFILTCAFPNNMVLLDNKSCFQINKILLVNNTLEMIGRTMLVKRPAFKFPCDSKEFFIFELNGNFSNEINISINNVKRKLIRLTVNETNYDRIYVLPFLQ